VASKNSTLVSQSAPSSVLVDVSALVAAYFSGVPDPSVAAQRVSFGTSGHRGSSLDRSFNEWHVLAITQAICRYRKAHNIGGPLFLGIDTHALSQPACASALEVLAANGVDVMLATNNEYTPTPAISHAILEYNRGRVQRSGTGLADGIVVTPSHNPPRDGGLKYNPPHGGPAGPAITGSIEAEANRLLESRLEGVKRIPYAKALQAATTRRHDFLNAYVADFGNVIDMDVIREAKLRMGVDPLGGAGVHYWSAIAERYRLDLTVITENVDPTFAFMPLDWDGKIRMDPSSPNAMQRLVDIKGRFDIAFACDTDHDRHGIVTPGSGLIVPDHYLAVAIDYLFRYRVNWAQGIAVGKTVVSSRLIDRLAARLGRRLFEVPVGFKWFADGLHSGALGFAGEESAGAAFLRRDGTVWTTDKDGILAALLSAEITARTGSDPGQQYANLAGEFGSPVARRLQAPATAQQKKQLAALIPQQITATELAGEPIASILSHAPGNGERIGGIKINTANGWFTARPSGTEDIYKIYAESFINPAHLQAIISDAQAIVDTTLSKECP
jgi:phosphoglucomutase